MKQVLARTGDAFFDSFVEEEEEDKKIVKEEQEIKETGDAFFDSFVKKEEPTEEETVETSTDKTPTPIDELYTKASDKEYAEKTYDEEGDKPIKTYKEFIKDKQFLNTANEYMIARFGEKEGQQEGESDAEFTDRFIEHYRNVNMNTLDLMGQVDWTRSANEKDKANFGALFRDMERLPSFYEEGGTGWFDGLMDYGSALLTDPLTYLGFGTGAIAKAGATTAVKKLFLETAKQATKQGMGKVAAREAAKAEVKRQSMKLGLKASAVPLAIETGAGVAEGYYHIGAGSEIDVAAHKREEEAGFGEKAFGGLLFGGVVGTIGGASALGMGKMGIKGAERSIKMQRIAKINGLKKQRALIQAKNGGDAKITTDSFDPIKGTEWDESVAKGKEVLEELDPSTDLTSASVQPDLLKRVTQVAKDALTDLKSTDKDKFEEFSKDILKKKRKASLVLRDMLQALSKEYETGAIDKTALEGAIKRAGLSNEQFFKIAFGPDVVTATTSKGGSVLGVASGFARYAKALAGEDPTLKKMYEAKFGKENPSLNIMGSAYDFVQRLDRERRALMVTQLSTTVRNVATGVMRLTFEGGANLIESALYNLGRGTKEFLTTGKVDPSAIFRSTKDMFYDAFDTTLYAMQGGETKGLVEQLLKYDPSIMRQIDRSLQEVGADQTLSWAARKANTLNMAQDKLFRRAVFTATLDKQLRRMGTNVREVIALDKTLPTKMLQNAMEESLAFTFARMPKAGGDKVGDNVGSLFVKMTEKLGPFPGLVGVPLGTGAFPYARFMVNALQFNLQYQPGSAIAAISNGAKGFINMAKQDKSYKELGAKQIAKAREQMSKGIIGSAAFYAAYKYRLEHQDDGTKWYEYKTEDGRTGDLRPFFPLAPYLLVGELFVNIRNKGLDGISKLSGKELLEGYTGATFRGGSSSYMIDSLFQAIGSEEGVDSLSGEKIAEYMSGYVGELVGGGITPIKMLTDIEAAFDVEAAYVRDSRQIEGFGGVERGLSSFKNQATRNLPFLGGLTDKFGQFVFGTNISAQSLPIAESATRDKPMIKQSTIGSQITGVRKEAVRNIVEKELADFNMKSWDVMPTSGEKSADAYTKRFMGEYVEKYLSRELEKESYQKLSGVKRKVAFKNKLKRYRKLAKEVAKAVSIGEEKAKGKSFTPFDRAQWGKLGSEKRALADDYYMSKHGKTVSEMQEEEPNKNHYLIGKILGNAYSKAYQ